MTGLTANAPSTAPRPSEDAGAPAWGEVLQETLALTGRLFLQLQRRPTTLVAGVLQPLIWLVLFGALFQRAPEGLLPGGLSYGHFLSAGIIVFTAFSGALNAGLPVMFDREFGFLNRLLVAPLRSRYSIVLASALYITSLSGVQTPRRLQRFPQLVHCGAGRPLRLRHHGRLPVGAGRPGGPVVCVHPPPLAPEAGLMRINGRWGVS